MRAGVGTLVTETQHIERRSGFGDRRKTRYVSRPLVFCSLVDVKRVKERAIEHRLKLAAQALEMQRVSQSEFGLEATVERLIPGHCERRFSYVNTQDR
jgi:hypothetical protein